MPSIAEKVKALDGFVIRYKERQGYYYRYYNKDGRSYTLKHITGANTIEEALANAYTVLTKAPEVLVPVEGSNHPVGVSPHPATHSRPVVGPQRGLRDASIADAVEAYLLALEKKELAGLKASSSTRRIAIILRQHLLNYLRLKGITDAMSLDEFTFDDYIVFRRGIAKQTLRIELREIQTFIKHHLVRHKLITGDIPTLPKVRILSEDLDANAAIIPSDYAIINKYLRKEWLDKAKARRGHYYRRMFHLFIHLLKNSGCRPSEVLSLRYKDITLTNPKRWSNSANAWVDDYKLELYIKHSKTGKSRVVYCRSNVADTMIAFLGFQREYSKDFNRCDEHLVFGNPEFHYHQPYGYNHLGDSWRGIMADLKDSLTGNRYSDKPYTIYSLRTTFIEDCIAAGLDIYTVAKLCGNTVKVIERYYDKSDLARQQRSIQNIKRGVRKAPPITTLDPLNL